MHVPGGHSDGRDQAAAAHALDLVRISAVTDIFLTEDLVFLAQGEEGLDQLWTTIRKPIDDVVSGRCDRRRAGMPILRFIL